MKHSLKITLLLVTVFILAQLAGLGITAQYIDQAATEETGVTTFKELPMNMERPDVPESQSYIYIIVAVIIGTILVLLIMRFRGERLWRFWFFLAATLCLTMAFGAFIRYDIITIALAAVLSFYKVWRPNFYIHNLTEIFLYGGLAAIFVPIMNIYAAIVLLLFISAYDMFAVWQSKHMVKMAQFQSRSKVFAGIMIPYSLKDMKKHHDAQKKVHADKKAHKKGKKDDLEEKVNTKQVRVTSRNAILGGGDIGFPLLFAGVLLKTYGFWKVLIIPAVTAIALFLLLYYAKKDKFYPAMPYLSAGCFVGYLIVWLI